MEEKTEQRYVHGRLIVWRSMPKTMFEEEIPGVVIDSGRCYDHDALPGYGKVYVLARLCCGDELSFPIDCKSVRPARRHEMGHIVSRMSKSRANVLYEFQRKA